LISCPDFLIIVLLLQVSVGGVNGSSTFRGTLTNRISSGVTGFNGSLSWYSVIFLCYDGATLGFCVGMHERIATFERGEYELGIYLIIDPSSMTNIKP
jgi:hypothetical protein